MGVYNFCCSVDRSSHLSGVFFQKEEVDVAKKIASEAVAKVKDAKVLTAWIDKDNTIKESEGIRSVPTVILYNDGKEIKRWEAGLALALKISPSEIQIEVDKLTGANKW